ncbi:uncharacterized protein BO96DRAFT_399464 [Aspergillus niger CBS 101883]|uniref:Uncharacterized protein n=2 Tax=Aspergillus niger TaxID=5061 RepID=A2QY92_ASPNC|nr:uncharacterized protein BO96DRAFT_399464 [Aspergillus niger CBS 101883]XP_059601750.1 hypothetical protein An12g00430 [Aspergillus niger]PYH53551.1 hypothetical protein BO96DRAFT_399464 [Aspergillus niger CBS 101883]CAK40972.1 hypothetical protein An12g00430 [Aspergillus niger]
MEPPFQQQKITVKALSCIRIPAQGTYSRNPWLRVPGRKARKGWWRVCIDNGQVQGEGRRKSARDGLLNKQRHDSVTNPTLLASHLEVRVAQARKGHTRQPYSLSISSSPSPSLPNLPEFAHAPLLMPMTFPWDDSDDDGDDDRSPDAFELITILFPELMTLVFLPPEVALTGSSQHPKLARIWNDGKNHESAPFGPSRG